MLSPRVGYQPGGRLQPQDILDSLQAAKPSPATRLHGPLTDLPSPRIQCCNHILLCGHNQLLGSRGKFQGGKFELPNILLSPKGKRPGKWKGPMSLLHRTLWKKDNCTNTGSYHRHTCLGMHEKCLLMKRSDQKQDFQAMYSGTKGRKRENTPWCLM